MIGLIAAVELEQIALMKMKYKRLPYLREADVRNRSYYVELDCNETYRFGRSFQVISDGT